MRIGMDARLAGRGLGVASVITSVTRLVARRAEVVWIGDPSAAPPGVADCVLAPKPYPLLDTTVGERMVRKLGLDVMHFPANTGWLRPGSTPVVLTVHDAIWASGREGRSLRQLVGHRYLRYAVGRAARAAAVVTSPSATAARDVQRELGLGAAPLVVPNGIFDIATAPRARAEPPYVVAFGARDPRKRLALAIEAWRRAELPGLRLVILAGGGLPSDVDQPFPPGVELRGYLEREELEDVIAGALALLYPSDQEGFGLPVLEAMALGVPVISGLAPVTEEVGGPALMRIDPGDAIVSIASHIRALQGDPGMREERGRAGIEQARRFTWEAAAEGYLSAYESALTIAPSSTGG